MAKGGKHAKPRAAEGQAPAPELVGVLIERLRALGEEAPDEVVRTAVGADAGAIPAAARALAQEGADAPLIALVRVPAYAAAAVPALAAQRGATAAHVLERVAAEASDRATAKAARRALHALASQGVHVEIPRGAAEAAFRPPPTEGVVWQRALAGPFDGDGFRSVLLAQARTPAGSAMAIAILSERDGLPLFQSTRRTVRQLEKEWQAYVDRQDETMARPAPFGYVQWLLSEAADLTASRGNEIPEAYTAWRELTGGPPPDQSPKLIYDEVGVDPSAPPGGALMRSAQLLGEPEIEPWQVPADALGAYTGEILSAQTSQIVLSESAQQDRERQIVQRAVDEYFGGEERGYYKRRLEETALIFAHSDRRSQAEAALAAAVVLGNPSYAPAEAPLLLAIVARALDQAVELAAPTTEAGQAARAQLYGIGR